MDSPKRPGSGGNATTINGLHPMRLIVKCNSRLIEIDEVEEVAVLFNDDFGITHDSTGMVLHLGHHIVMYDWTLALSLLTGHKR